MIVQSKWFLTAWILTVCSSIQAADEPKPANPVTGPAVGESFPVFESTDDQGLSWKSSNHVGKKVLVLYFYPGDFTVVDRDGKIASLRNIVNPVTDSEEVRKIVEALPK